jgi:hypothetical protein
VDCDVTIGARWNIDPATSTNFEGILDEVRISKTARPAAWTQAEYNNISNAAGFFLTGIEEGPATNGDPFQNGWTYRKRLTIDASRVAADLTNFPVLINTTDADWKEDGSYGGHMAQDDGGDIIFTAGDGVTRLYHEIEKYEPSTGQLVAWVKVPSLSSSTNTNIYIYYGNTSLGVDQNQWNTAGLWPTGYKGIYHFAEDPSITTDGDCAGGIYHICDATLNDNDGETQGGMAPGQLVSAKVGDGLDFDGSDDRIFIKQTDDFDRSVITVQAWINTSSTAEKRIMMNNTSGTNDWCFTMEDNNGSASVLFSNSPSADENQMTDITLADGQWHHVVAISDPTVTNIKIYVDGNLAATATDPGESFGGGNANNPVIGRHDSLIDQYFLGKMDEVRVYDGALTAEWIATEFNNQQAPAAFYTVGIEETTGTGADPFQNGWTYRKRITIDSAQVDCDLTNFPVLISTTDPDLTAAQANFNDILFTAADGTTKLDHEIEDYDSGSGNLVAWVEVRSVSSTSDTDIYLYYGNGNAVDQRNPTGAGVWEPNYLGVWHLKEDPSGAAPQIKDSTANANHGTSSGGMLTGDQVPGKIDGSLDFDGSDDEISISDAIIGDRPAWTITAWMKMGADAALQRMIYSEGHTTADGYLFLYVDDTETNVRFYSENSVGDYARIANGTTNVEDNQFHHVAMVQQSKTNRALFVDTVSQGTDILNAGTLTHNIASIGSLRYRWGSYDFFKGIIDEVRISKIDRDTCWIEAEHSNQLNPAGFYTIGLEEQDDTEGDPLQNGWTYRKRLTIDASRVAGDLTNFPLDGRRLLQRSRGPDRRRRHHLYRRRRRDPVVSRDREVRAVHW